MDNWNGHSHTIIITVRINRFTNVGVKVFYKRKDALNLIENL